MNAFQTSPAKTGLRRAVPPPDPATALAASPLFAPLNRAALQRIAEEFRWAFVPGGDVLVRQGAPGDALFIVVSGRLRVVLTDPEGAEWTVREVGRGENVGEMALLTGAPRSATVRAVRDTHVGVLTQPCFERILRTHPAIALALTRMLASWVSRTNEATAVADTPATIALHPVDRGVPTVAFAERFADALAALGSTRRLSAGDLDDALGPGASNRSPGDPGHAEVSRWLAEQEAASRFVLYEGDASRPAWTRRCLRQADRILTLVWNNPTSARTTVEPAGVAGVQERLVVLHSTDTEAPQNTRRFGPERFGGFHHVRLGRDGDYGRLARHLTGRAVGLVLGGGGARGFAHIGVIAALREAGLPIDHLGGTSMGAVLGALCAQEMSADEMSEVSRLWAAYRPNQDYTAPVIALLSGRKGRAMLEKMFGDRRIEDLWTPYFAVTADLVHAEQVIHRTGPLTQWMVAGISIPGIAPPFPTDDGRLLVDGGVLNNVPADVMQRLSGGTVIAVDVSAKDDLSLNAWSGEFPSAVDVLRDRVRPRNERRPYPGLFHILMRSSSISSVRRVAEARQAVALYLEPPVQGFDLFGWDRLDALVEVGRRHATDRLAAWERLPELAIANLP